MNPTVSLRWRGGQKHGHRMFSSAVCASLIGLIAGQLALPLTPLRPIVHRSLLGSDLIWELDAGQLGAPVLLGPRELRGGVLAVLADGTLVAFSAVSGDRFWTRQTDTNPTHFEIVGDRLYLIGTQQGSQQVVLTSFDSSAGVCWETELANPVDYVAFSEDWIVVCLVSGELVLLEASSGQIQWSILAQESIVAAPRIGADSVIVATELGLQSRALENADLNWTRNLRGGAKFRPALVKNTLVVASGEGKVVGVNLSDGKQKWRLDIGGELGSDPVRYKKTVLVTGYASQLVRLKTGGHSEWRVAVDGRTSIATQVWDDHALVVSGRATSVTGYELKEGRQVGVVRLKGWTESIAAPPVMLDHHLVVRTSSGRLLGFGHKPPPIDDPDLESEESDSETDLEQETAEKTESSGSTAGETELAPAAKSEAVPAAPETESIGDPKDAEPQQLREVSPTQLEPASPAQPVSPSSAAQSSEPAPPKSATRSGLAGRDSP